MKADIHSKLDRRRSFQRVFTLTELLVVIAVIAILATLLLPTLKGAVSMSKEVFCGNNLKSLHTSTHSYCGDYRDKIIAYMGTTPDEQFYHTLLLGGNYLSSTEKRIFMCPEYIGSNGLGNPAVFGSTSPNYYYSYGMVLDGPSKDSSNPESDGWSKYSEVDGIPTYVVDAKMAGSPSRQPIYADSVSDSSADGGVLYSTPVYAIKMGSTRWGGSSFHLHGRHNNVKACTVFSDGHTGTMRGGEFRTFLKTDCGYSGQYFFFTVFPFREAFSIN